MNHEPVEKILRFMASQSRMAPVHGLIPNCLYLKNLKGDFMRGKSVFAVYLDSIGFGMFYGKSRLDIMGLIVYNHFSTPTEPLLKSKLNSGGFFFFGGSYEIQ